MERTRLQADVVQPAESARVAAEANAKAEAAPIIENGRAQAQVLEMLYQQSQQGGKPDYRYFWQRSCRPCSAWPSKP